VVTRVKNENSHSLPNVLFLDNEESILRLFKLQLAKFFNVFITTNPNEGLLHLSKIKVDLVICDYHMDSFNGVDFLTEVKKLYPSTKRVIVTGRLDLDIAMDSANIANVHLIIKKPWVSQDLISQFKGLIAQIREEEQIEQKDREKYKLLMKQHQGTNSHDELLQLLISLSQSKSNADFSNQFIETIIGMRSLSIINFEYFLDSSQDKFFEQAIEHLTDIEVIASQYEQRLLLTYVWILKAYMYLITKDVQSAANLFEGCLINQIGSTEVTRDKIVSRAIENFPLNFVDNPGDFHVSSTMLPGFEVQSRNLFKMNVENLINISRKLFKIYGKQRSDIFYIIVIRDEMPLFVKKNAQTSR